MQVRDAVPVRSQSSANPPQLPKPVQLVVPQPFPSVSRVHPAVSVLVEPTHVPLTQAKVVTLRLFIPLRPHMPLKPPQSPQAPGSGGPQSSATRQPVHTSMLSSHTADPLHGLPACAEHDPSLQVSAPLQNTPSLHGAVLFTFSQPAAPHASSVHGLPSSQPAGTHIPAQHISPAAQRLSRSQRSPTQVALWQGPATHVAAVHSAY